MKKIINFSFWLLLTAGVAMMEFTSCKQQSQQLSDKKRSELFSKICGLTPEASFQVTPEKIAYYVVKGSKEEMDLTGWLFILEKKENQWIEAASKELGDLVFGSSVDSIQIVKLGEKSYVYYETKTGGGNSGNYSLFFGLYDCDNYELYGIDYEYVPGETSSNPFSASPNLSASPDLKSFLEEKAYASPNIKIEDEADKFEKNFLTENNAAMKKLKKSSKEWVQFIPIRTKRAFFEFDNNNPVAENDSFKVIALFKGAVMGYDKQRKEYLMIWGLENHYEWVDELSFDASGNLLMHDVSGWGYTVDLNNNRYMKN